MRTRGASSASTARRPTLRRLAPRRPGASAATRRPPAMRWLSRTRAHRRDCTAVPRRLTDNASHSPQPRRLPQRPAIISSSPSASRPASNITCPRRTSPLSIWRSARDSLCPFCHSGCVAAKRASPSSVRPRRKRRMRRRGKLPANTTPEFFAHHSVSEL